MYEWFKSAKTGLIIHLGLYSISGGEYSNKKMSSYCEWIQSFARTPKNDYEKLLNKFNPYQLIKKKMLRKYPWLYNFKRQISSCWKQSSSKNSCNRWCYKPAP